VAGFFIQAPFLLYKKSILISRNILLFLEDFEEAFHKIIIMSRAVTRHSIAISRPITASRRSICMTSPLFASSPKLRFNLLKKVSPQSAQRTQRFIIIDYR